MGNAGIIRELLRFARAGTGRTPAYAVPWPDHPGACPKGSGHEQPEAELGRVEVDEVAVALGPPA